MSLAHRRLPNAIMAFTTGASLGSGMLAGTIQGQLGSCKRAGQARRRTLRTPAGRAGEGRGAGESGTRVRMGGGKEYASSSGGSGLDSARCAWHRHTSSGLLSKEHFGRHHSGSSS